MVKITVPPKFGLVPQVITHTVPNLRGEPGERQCINSSMLPPGSTDAGWTAIPDPAGQHVLFFNYPFGVLAIDALPRNCYLHDGQLLPFDVILCKPGVEMEHFLKLYA